jgi:16S rRNA (guanine966-N2)-methyltransferase
MPPRHRNPNALAKPARQPVGVRIIGGRLRGRQLAYSGDMRTRPMKDRLREAIFNLIGPAVKGLHAIDLFAGTGALGLEAISRGASRATLIEQHFPTANLIRRNAAELKLADVCQIVAADTFIWWRRHPDLGQQPQVIFCSPPYELYATRTADMVDLVSGLFGAAPTGSILVVEADHRFDFSLLQEHGSADVRSYPPAVVGLLQKG